jgi:hypothetical protein
MRFMWPAAKRGDERACDPVCPDFASAQSRLRAKAANQERSGVALAASSHGIPIELAERPTADMAARLLLALTALYVQRPTHTAEEQHQYGELALRLIDKVETATYSVVADMLRRHPDAPAEVAARLGGRQSSRDGDPRAEPRSSPDQRCPVNQPLKCDLGIGQRASAEAASDAPAEQSATLTPEFGEAFFAASPAERRRLLSLIADSYGDDPAVAPEDGERVFASIDALHGRIGEFAREFERLIDVPRRLYERILNDPSGEPMVVAAKAAGMPIAILQRILLLVDPAASHSVEHVYDLTELYHDLGGRTARDLLVQWRTQAAASDSWPEMEAQATDGSPDAPISVASLRSRFGALTERVRNQAFNVRCDRGSAGRRGLRSQ